MWLRGLRRGEPLISAINSEKGLILMPTSPKPDKKSDSDRDPDTCCNEANEHEAHNDAAKSQPKEHSRYELPTGKMRQV